MKSSFFVVSLAAMFFVGFAGRGIFFPKSHHDGNCEPGETLVVEAVIDSHPERGSNGGGIFTDYTYGYHIRTDDGGKYYLEVTCDEERSEFTLLEIGTRLRVTYQENKAKGFKISIDEFEGIEILGSEKPASSEIKYGDRKVVMDLLRSFETLQLEAREISKQNDDLKKLVEVLRGNERQREPKKPKETVY